MWLRCSAAGALAIMAFAIMALAASETAIAHSRGAPSAESSDLPGATQPAAPSQAAAQAMAAMPSAQAVPNNAQYVEQAIACMNERKSLAPALVVKSCDAVIDETIRNLANAYYFRGGATLTQRDYDGAIASFSQAIKLDPMQSEYLTGRAAA